jgi:hypothetical protein
VLPKVLDKYILHYSIDIELNKGRKFLKNFLLQVDEEYPHNKNLVFRKAYEVKLLVSLNLDQEYDLINQ